MQAKIDKNKAKATAKMAAKAAAQGAAKTAVKTGSPRAYHHGNLRQALIDAAVALVEEGGAEGVSVREAARRAGVSAGAPFRHFPSRQALMTAVAEEAMRRFRSEIAQALEKVSGDDPLVRFRAIGSAYLRWALRNPTHFRVLSTQNLFDFEQAATLRKDNDQVIAMSAGVLADAAGRGLLRSDDVALVHVAGRALVYGFARMQIDGHFPRWGVRSAEAEQVAEAILDLFLAGITRER